MTNYHPVSDTHGYAVDEHHNTYTVAYTMRTVKMVQGQKQETLKWISNARSMGRLHAYDTLDKAVNAIKEIQKLYG